MWKKLLSVTIVMLALVRCTTLSPVPTDTLEPTKMPTLTPTATPTNTLTATATTTLMPTNTSTPTSTPSPTNTPKPTYTPEPTATSTSTPTHAPTNTPKPTNTPLPTNTPIPPTDTPQAEAPHGSKVLADGVWRCPNSTAGAAYVGSYKSDKFHYPNCRWAEKIKDENRVCFASRSAAIAYGYVACGTCKP